MSYKVRASRLKGQDILVVFQNPGPRATMRRKTSRRPTGPGAEGGTSTPIYMHTLALLLGRLLEIRDRILAVNGVFFDPYSLKSTSIVQSYTYI